MSNPVLFVVTEALSKVYYKGLPSQPRLIATTKPSPFEEPSGPEAYPILKELRQLGDHPLARVWDHGLSEGLRRGLNTAGVNWTSLDAARIVNVGEYSRLAIVWIGVEFGAPSFEEGSVVAAQCRTLINSYNIHDYHVEIRESRVMGQASNSRPLVSPDFHRSRPIHRDPRPWAEGTAGFYLSVGGDDKNIYLVTARHVVLPIDKDDNKEYECTNTSKAREDVVVLCTSGFNEKLAAIDYDIRGQESAITDAKERIRLVEGVNDPESVTERKAGEQDLKKAVEGLEALMTLRHEITTQWEAKEKRVIGELVWAPPIVLSTEPGEYTLDLAVIKIDAGTLDAKNYRGNSINIGNKYTRQQFMDKVYPNPTSPPSVTSFKFPADRIVTLQDQVPESDLVKPPMLDANGDQCLVVFKNGAKTVSGVEGVAGHSYRHALSGAFSAKGDSGSGVADALGRVGGILISGTSDPNATGAVDVTYVTPISFITKVLHNSKRFEHAHLNPVLA